MALAFFLLLLLLLFLLLLFYFLQNKYIALGGIVGL